MIPAYLRSVTSTRERALAAAIDVVGEQGIRALTHGRIDAHAGLPKGSTSNWFRTRAALLAGLVYHIAEAERADAAASDVSSPEELVDALCGLIETATTTHAARTRVRFALFLEMAHDSEVLAPMLRQRTRFVDWTAGLLERLGATAPEESARTLLACGNGLVFHRLTV